MQDTFPARPRRALPALAAGLALATATAAGCSTYVGTTASSFLHRVRDDPDPNVRYLAYARLARPNCYDNEAQKAEAVRTLVAKLEEGKEPVATRAVILQTLGALRDPAARGAVLKAVNDPEPVIRVQACRALGTVGRGEDATVLARVMTTDTLEDCRIAAIEALGALKPDDPRIARVLVAAMRHDDPATRLAALNALRKLTGRDAGVDAEAWARLLPGEAGDKPPTLLAAPSPAPVEPAPAPPAVSTAAAAPTYPPRPDPLPTVDPLTQPAGLPRNPGADAAAVFGRGAAAPAAPAAGAYPSHNPNLPAAPTDRRP